MTFFERIKMWSPIGVTDKEISDKLGVTEVALFTACPFLLDLPEDQQNQIIEYIWRITLPRSN
jgi:hypothetical protein